MLALLVAGVSDVWAVTKTSVVTASRIGSASVTWNGTQKDVWTITITGGQTNQAVTNDYAQIGSRNYPSISANFSTSGIPGTITSIVVDCAAYNGNATISATVGGSSFGTQNQSVPRWNNNTGGNVTFSGNASGAISITMTNGTSGQRAMYIKSITITYDVNVVTWNDGVLEYSTEFIKSSSETVYLTDNQVAVRLYCPKEKTVTDLEMYYADNASGIKNWNGDALSITSTTTASDDDYDDVGETATYEYVGVGSTNLSNSQRAANYFGGQPMPEQSGRLGDSGYDYAFYFNRTHEIAYSDVENVVIPVKVTNPDTNEEYTVVAIQKWGFCYSENESRTRKMCQNASWSTGGVTQFTGTEYTEYGNINNHSNDYIKSVTFAEGTQVKYIGDYAFMSCHKLETITIPRSVIELGQGLFECDYALEEVKFQLNADNTVNFPTIREYTFWFCTGLKKLEVPEGVTEIGLKALMYNKSLTSLTLPNTLTKVGAHFVCVAQSLEMLIMPASLTHIDGACFHGCENLRTVYMLGYADDLKGAEGQNATFGANGFECSGHVNHCTFYVPQAYLSQYQSHSVWDDIDEDGSVTNNHYGNWLKAIPAHTRDFTGGQWVTAIFPNKVENYKNTFGSKSKVALMTGAHSINEDPYRYHLTFTLQDFTDIPQDIPYLFYPENTVTGFVLYVDADMMDADGRMTRLTQKYYRTVTADNTHSEGKNAAVQMIGEYNDTWEMVPGDFFFANSANTGYSEKVEGAVGNFYKVTSASSIRSCRCLWKIFIDGVVEDSAGAKLGMMSFDDDNTTAIDKVEKPVEIVIDAIYDVNGRKLDLDYNELSKGLYIINGKKIMKK